MNCEQSIVHHLTVAFPLKLLTGFTGLYCNLSWFLLFQAGILNPLLRRTASAKHSLRRAPSALFIEHGKVFQRKKVMVPAAGCTKVFIF